MKAKTRGAMGLLISGALAMAVLTIIGILVFQLNEDARADLTNGGYGENATIEADKAEFKIFSNLDLVALALVFGVIIYIILKVLPVNVSGF